ncbi:helix-turn-helix transcriptional regulator [Burkholderia cenocepacia]|uniref:helix-turn-helix transcriptional regulator n=1 Tax=Burkholderia cenocepacia TaxID=95486 RepID=UPI001E5D9D31|nr:helix-turn-helix transcriptional regulator [Burkholderia cenocepacia]MCG0577452.1 helix-turn-helix transcriptional regulator [Burkholderia cenocepacia]MCW5127916.1 helix-turn-helix transcriptional regulator [Burkholderia cenocepacia]MDN7547180.1 helix-turn-helix transcriptional regulator [Burkholderia cenocepacia]MDN7661687.1 helix-turn-helix transcriptional regulator [Burkholderia cenocepacia]
MTDRKRCANVPTLQAVALRGQYRVLRARVGMPPLEYLTRWRMMLARRALRTDTEPLSAIALRIGYESDTAFGLAFRRHHGVSPGRYRTAMRARHNAAAVPGDPAH